MFKILTERKLLWPGVMTLVGLAILIGLGTWQLQRKEWKEGLIAAIEARTKAEPVPIAQAIERLEGGQDVEYMRVNARGRLLNDKERFFYAPDQMMGPGYHVYTPLELTDGGKVIFVNRGFVPDARKDPETRKEGRPEGEIVITGLLRMPAAKGIFEPANDVGRNLWYWRDLDGLMRSAFGNSGRAAVMLFLEAEAPAPGGWPKGGATLVELPNRHLEYAMTWFGLAIALAAVFAVYAAPRLRRPNH